MKIILWKSASVEIRNSVYKALTESLGVADELHLVLREDLTVETIELDNFGNNDDEYFEKVVIHNGNEMHVITLEEELEDEENDVVDDSNALCFCSGNG